MKSEWKGQDIVLGVVPAENNARLPEDVENQLGAEAHYFQANSLAAAGQLGNAIPEYQTAIRIDPQTERFAVLQIGGRVRHGYFFGAVPVAL